ncbi:MAG: hypothetical protein AAGH53_05420 [Pseudomonadota bacterium]
MPTVSYVEGLKIIRDLVLGWCDINQAKRAAHELKSSPSRTAVIEFVEAFCQYASTRQYTGVPAFSDFSVSFPIGRELFVPVRPTLVSRENGEFRPTFVFGWKSVPLDDFQRRLLMTILEDAIFSLTDFQNSDAEIIFLPEEDGVRTPEIWNRGDYALLSETQMRNQMELFLSAREMAYPIIEEWLKSRKPVVPEDNRTEADDRQQVLRLDPPSRE